MSTARRRAGAVAVLATTVLVAACSDGERDQDQHAGGGGSLAIGGAAATGGDVGDRCDQALALEQSVNVLEGIYFEHRQVIDPAGDQDAYRFEAQAGQWFGMVTQANPERDPTKVDTVLALFDESGREMLARSDDAVPPPRSDSEIIHRFAESGSYCLQVTERSAWMGGVPEGDPSFRYRLLVYPVDFERYDDWNLDQEPNDELSGAQGLSAVSYDGMPFARMVGSVESADVDVFRFQTGTVGDGLHVGFTPSGPSGNGASAGPGLLRLRRDDAEQGILAELDYRALSRAGYSTDLLFGMAIEAEQEQSYLLEVTRPAHEPVGDNDFYVLWAQTSAGAFSDIEPNDDPVEAVFSAGAVPHHPNARVHHIHGTLPPGDVDWWTTDLVPPGTTIRALCASWQLGSSLRDATFALYPAKCPVGDCTGAADEPLLAQTETQDVPVRWSDDEALNPSAPAIVVQAEGVHYLRVSASQYEPGIESTYYACYMTTWAP